MKNFRKQREGFLGTRSITSIIIFVNIFLFVVFLLLTLTFGEKTINYVALNPENFLNGKYMWTLITHMFMHAGFFHLLINMFALYSLGSFSEKLIGRKRFFWFYLISGIFAGLLSVILAGYFGYGVLAKLFGTGDVFMVGASGAIFAIAGLFVTLLPKIKFSIIFFPFFSLPGYIMVPLVLVITWLASIAANLPVGNVAHFGGLIFGVVYGYYLRRKYRKKVMMIERYFK